MEQKKVNCLQVYVFVFNYDHDIWVKYSELQAAQSLRKQFQFIPTKYGDFWN